MGLIICYKRQEKNQADKEQCTDEFQKCSDKQVTSFFCFHRFMKFNEFIIRSWLIVQSYTGKKSMSTKFEFEKPRFL